MNEANTLLGHTNYILSYNLQKHYSVFLIEFKHKYQLVSVVVHNIILYPE